MIRETIRAYYSDVISERLARMKRDGWVQVTELEIRPTAERGGSAWACDMIKFESEHERVRYLREQEKNGTESSDWLDSRTAKEES